MVAHADVLKRVRNARDRDNVMSMITTVDEMTTAMASIVVTDVTASGLIEFELQADDGQKLQALMDPGSDTTVVNTTGPAYRNGWALKTVGQPVKVQVTGSSGKTMVSAARAEAWRVSYKNDRRKAGPTELMPLPVRWDVIVGLPFFRRHKPQFVWESGDMCFPDGACWCRDHTTASTQEQVPVDVRGDTIMATTIEAQSMAEFEPPPSMSARAAGRRQRLSQGDIVACSVTSWMTHASRSPPDTRDAQARGETPVQSSESDTTPILQGTQQRNTWAQRSPSEIMSTATGMAASHVVGYHFPTARSRTTDDRGSLSVSDRPRALPSEEDVQTFRKQLATEFADVNQCKDSMPKLRDRPDNQARHRIDFFDGAEKEFKKRTPIRLNPEQRQEMEKYLAWLLDRGFVEPSDSGIVSAVFFVEKPRGSDGQRRWRWVQDFREVNRHTKRDQHPTPDLQEQIARAAGHEIYSKFDFVTGFYLIRMDDEAKHRSAFVCPGGLGTYQWNVMPMGLVNAPATFNRKIQKLFGRFTKHWGSGHTDWIGQPTDQQQRRRAKSWGLAAYVDDVIVFSNDWEKHKQQVRDFMFECRAQGLYINIEKSEIAVPNIEFLGEAISKHGRQPQSKRVQDIRQRPPPKSFGDVRSFLGHIGYLSEFIPHFSHRSKPLNAVRSGKLGSGGAQPAFESVWGDKQQAAYEDLRDAVTRAPVLRPPNFSQPFFVECDASNVAVGAALLQAHGEKLLPVAYGSRTLLDNEMAWPTHDRELAAIKFGLTKFRHYLCHGHVTVVTDHRPLIHFQQQPHLTARQLGMLDTIEEIGPRFVYRKGSMMSFADLLSRPPGVHPDLAELTAKVSMSGCEVCEQATWDAWCEQHREHNKAISAHLFANEITEHTPALEMTKVLSGYTTNNDPAMRKIIDGLNHPGENHFKRRYRLDADGLIFTRPQLGDSTPQSLVRLVISPTDDQSVRAAIANCHSRTHNGHMGVNSTVDRVQRRFFIPGVKRLVTKFVQTCHECQFSRHQTMQTPGKSRPLELPSLSPGSHLSTDFTFDLPSSKHPISGVEYTGAQVYVCRLTGRVRFLPVNPEITAEQAAIMYHMEVRSQWGSAVDLVSDRDGRFASGFWQDYCKATGMHLSMSSTDHPQTDGQSEQVFAMLGVMLRAFAAADNRDWVQNIPDLEFALNTHRRTSRGGMSSMEVWQGYRPLEPIDLAHPELIKTVAGHEAGRIQQQRRAMQLARECLAIAQDTRAAVADSHRRAVTYEPGDQVLIHKSALIPPSDESRSKLAKRKGQQLWHGPVTVQSHRGNSVRISDLPAESRAHPVFNVGVIKPWHRNAHRTDPTPAALPTYDEDGATVRNVGAILGHRVKRERHEWKVRWAGASETFDSWHQLPAFVSSQGVTQALLDYEQARTGSASTIWSSVGQMAPPAQYEDGAEGTYTNSADGFRLYHAIEGETVEDVAYKSGADVETMLRLNTSRVSNLRRHSTRFDFGFAVRIGPSTGSPRAIFPLCVIRAQTQRVGDGNQDFQTILRDEPFTSDAYARVAGQLAHFLGWVLQLHFILVF